MQDEGIVRQSNHSAHHMMDQHLIVHIGIHHQIPKYCLLYSTMIMLMDYLLSCVPNTIFTPMGVLSEQGVNS